MGEGGLEDFWLKTVTLSWSHFKCYFIQAFLSPQRANITQCSNKSAVYSEWNQFCLKLKKKNCCWMHWEKMISMKKDLIDLHFTIKFSAATGKEYCESKGKWNSMVELFSTSTGRNLSSLKVTTKPFMTLMNPSTSNRHLYKNWPRLLPKSLNC